VPTPVLQAQRQAACWPSAHGDKSVARWNLSRPPWAAITLIVIITFSGMSIPMLLASVFVAIVAWAVCARRPRPRVRRAGRRRFPDAA
jgi:hypothetical protein